MNFKSTRGFSLVELILIIVIMGIITFITVGSFSKATGQEALDKETGIVLSLIEQARNQTLSSKNNANYGVHFETTKAVLFSGSVYSSSDASNVVEILNPLVEISSIALAGGVSDTVFKRLTGETAQSGTITVALSSDTTQTKTITVFATGVAQSN